jgi:NYN domain
MDLSAPISNRTKHRVAILVDGDNVPHSDLQDLEKHALQWGEITIRRVFGDMTLHKGWANESRYTATHCTTAAGKNRADMALVVAAMDFAHRGLASAFVIASDDRDFEPLVSHLREQGLRVDRVGKTKATALRPTKPVVRSSDQSLLDEKLVGVISSQPDASTGIPLVRLGHLMKGETVKVQTGKTTWRAYLKGKPDIFVIDGEGTASRVRLKT